MSLTSQLKTPESPVRKFVREQFPGTRPVVQEANRELRQISTIKPDRPVDWGTVGTAIDYRIRYYFNIVPYDKLAAWKGSKIITGRDVRGSREEFDDPERFDELVRKQEARSEVFGGIVEEFFTGLENELARIQPKQKRLEREDEELLARYCVGLALFEQVYRTGRIPPGSLLIEPGYVESAGDLLARVPEHWVDDLCLLSWKFYDEHAGFLKCPAVLNPTFDGSRDVGGADADFIVDQCLVDIKATVNPKLSGDMLYQLLGYVLLDYTDQYRINEVGIYFARQGKLIRWPLDELLGTVTVGETRSLSELRDEFATVTQTLRSG